MTVLHARVEGEIEIPLGEIPTEVLEAIKAQLSFENEEKQKQLNEQIWSAQNMPDVINMWTVERRRSGAELLCIPRGFASQLVGGCAAMGVELQIEDHRTKVPAAPGYYRPFAMRDYQLDAALALIQWQQGFYKGPAGSGKTVTMLGTLAWVGQRALVVVDKESLLEQWRLRAADFFGFAKDEVVDKKTGEVSHVASLSGARTVGKIGKGVWEERDLTIALFQTLHARKDESDVLKWWKTWGATVFDEGHHMQATTIQGISRETTSFYFWGTSATPFTSETGGRIIQSLVGPIIHETPRRLLVKRGILIDPEVHFVDTEFHMDFWNTHTYWPAAGERCQIPGCKKPTSKHQHRNNYSSVLKEIVVDEDRNRLIAENIARFPNDIHLIPIKRLSQPKIFRKALAEVGWEGEIFDLTGKENAEGIYQAIIQKVEALARAGIGAVLISTVAQEALDVPPIKHVHIVFPMKQDAATEQLAGRAGRAWEGKDTAHVWDYRDYLMEVLTAQSQAREYTYRRLEFPIRTWVGDDPAEQQLRALEGRPYTAEELAAVPVGNSLSDFQPAQEPINDEPPF